MTEVIADTNVAVIANRQNADVVESCENACIQFIAACRQDRVVLLDDAGEIMAEYMRAIRHGQPPLLGALFFRHIQQNQYNTQHVRRIHLPKQHDGTFFDFPDAPELATFDLADRKFAALSRKTGVAVTNAIDSDWANDLSALNAHGIAVDFLCGCRKDSWFRS